jgi:hypothetical protein
MRSRLFLLDLSRGNEPSFNIHQSQTSTFTVRSDENLYEMETVKRVEQVQPRTRIASDSLEP